MSHILSYWSIRPFPLVALGLLAAGYITYHNGKTGKWLQSFLIALVLSGLCSVSPLYILSNEYLFSAHMAVHVLLLLIVGPLLVLSLRKQLDYSSWISAISKRLYERPLIGWLTGVGIMWLWHIPVFFNYAMLSSETPAYSSVLIHLFETVSLIAAGMIFSWAVISPVRAYRLPPLSGVLYLFTACIGCSLLGLIITFAPAGLYHHFLSAVDGYGLNDFILNNWGMSQAMDQQIAGLIMWVPCCLLYLLYAIYLLTGWFKEKEEGNSIELVSE